MAPTNRTWSRETTPNVATSRVIKFESSPLKMVQLSLFGVTVKKKPFFFLKCCIHSISLCHWAPLDIGRWETFAGWVPALGGKSMGRSVLQRQGEAGTSSKWGRRSSCLFSLRVPLSLIITLVLFLYLSTSISLSFFLNSLLSNSLCFLAVPPDNTAFAMVCGLEVCVCVFALLCLGGQENSGLL